MDKAKAAKVYTYTCIAFSPSLLPSSPPSHLELYHVLQIKLKALQMYDEYGGKVLPKEIEGEAAEGAGGKMEGEDMGVRPG